MADKDKGKPVEPGGAPAPRLFTGQKQVLVGSRRLGQMRSDVGLIGKAKIALAHRLAAGAQRLTASYMQPVGAGGIGQDRDEALFVPITPGAMYQDIDRVLNKYTTDKLQRISAWTFETNPAAQRYINLKARYICGRGFTIRASDPKVQAVLDEHWFDPDNDWPIKQFARVRDLQIFGEGIWPTFVNEVNGHTKIGYLDPYLVKRVEAHPEDKSRPKTIILNPPAGGKESDAKTFEVIRQDEDDADFITANDGMARLKGGAFYFATNQLMASSRGFSSMLCLVDWFSAYSQFVWTRAENRARADEYALDVTLKGYTDDEIQDFANGFDASPGTGKVRFHNEDVSFEAISANMRSQDAKEESKLLAGQITSGTGFPYHWLFGLGDTTNRAAALAMGDPTEMDLYGEQLYYHACICRVLDFHLQNVRFSQSDKLKGVKDFTYELERSPINVEDEAENAKTLNDYTDSITKAEAAGYIDKDEAAELWAMVASRIGRDVEIAKALQTEEGKARARVEKDFDEDPNDE